MKGKLILENGHEIEIELTAEQVQQIDIKTQWPQVGDKHFYLNILGTAMFGTHNGFTIDNAMIRIGNYFKTKQEAENMARALKLIEAIRQDRIKINGDWKPVLYEDKAYIFLDDMGLKIEVYHSCIYTNAFGAFRDTDGANYIINKYHDELLWYFVDFLPERG